MKKRLISILLVIAMLVGVVSIGLGTITVSAYVDEGTLRYNLDGIMSFTTYDPNTTPELGMGGWAYNSNGSRVTAHATIDGRTYALPMGNRQDVVNAFPGQCKQVDCGFNDTINLRNLSPGPHSVRYFLVTDNREFNMAQGTITIKDGEAPKISQAYVTDKTENGFTLVVTASDNVGVTRVSCPTWRPDLGEGGNNAKWIEANYDASIGAWTCYVDVANTYEGHAGTYETHAYAYDAQGNETHVKVPLHKMPKFQVALDYLSPDDVFDKTNNDSIYLRGWAFNHNGSNTDVYYNIDNGDWVKCNTETRQDVFDAFSACSQVNCGYNSYIYAKDLSNGPHTLTIAAYSDEVIKVIATKSFTVTQTMDIIEALNVNRATVTRNDTTITLTSYVNAANIALSPILKDGSRVKFTNTGALTYSKDGRLVAKEDATATMTCADGKVYTVVFDLVKTSISVDDLKTMSINRDSIKIDNENHTIYMETKSKVSSAVIYNVTSAGVPLTIDKAELYTTYRYKIEKPLTSLYKSKLTIQGTEYALTVKFVPYYELVAEKIKTIRVENVTVDNEARTIVLDSEDGVKSVVLYNITTDRKSVVLENENLTSTYRYTINKPENGKYTGSVTVNGVEYSLTVNFTDFASSGNFAYEINGSDIILRKYKGTNDEVIVPSTIKIDGFTYNVVVGKVVLEKASDGYMDPVDGPFYNNKIIKSVIFRDGVKIEDGNAEYMFMNTNIEEVYNIPEGTTDMYAMFYACASLKTVDAVPSTVKIMQYSFTKCRKLGGELNIKAADVEDIDATVFDKVGTTPITVYAPAGRTTFITLQKTKLSNGLKLLGLGDDTQYVVFMITNMTHNQIEPYLSEMIRLHGKVDPASKRKYAFGVPGPMCITQSISEMNRQVNHVFELAEKYDIPVYFQMDDCTNYATHFGDGATTDIFGSKFYNDPEMCEWIAFPKAGESWGGQSNGMLPRWHCDWSGVPFATAGGFPCYNSEKYLAWYKNQVTEGFIKPLMENYNRLKAEGKGYLFAGLNTGWETQIPNYTNSTMNSLLPFEKAQYGMHALHNMGYTEASLQAEANSRGISVQALMTEILCVVLHNYIEFTCKLFYDAGIERHKIISHTVSIASSTKNYSTVHPPLWVCVNDYSTPGWTMSPKTCPYDLQEVKETLVSHGRNEYANAEGYAHYDNVETCRAYFQESLLGNAKLITVFGYDQGTGTYGYAKDYNFYYAQVVREWLNYQLGADYTWENRPDMAEEISDAEDGNGNGNDSGNGSGSSIVPNEFVIQTTPVGANSFSLNATNVASVIEGDYVYNNNSYTFSNFLRFNLNKDVDIYNYFGLKYTSDTYLKGKYIYTNTSGYLMVEDFFLEPGTNVDFYCLIEGYLIDMYSRNVASIEFYPLNATSSTVKIHGLSTFNKPVVEREVYLSTSEYKIGVDMLWGGALSYMEDMNSNVQAVKVNGVVHIDSNASARYGKTSINNNVNLINRWDPGRLVQQSYYGTMGNGDGYQCGEFMGNTWGYNPVQGGNQFGESSKIVDLRVTNDTIYVKCRPLDWAKRQEHITPSYMEAIYKIEGKALKVTCRFVDFSGYNPRVSTQELPAFYCSEPLNRFVYYGGNAPWTGDNNIACQPDLIFWPDAGYPNFTSKECWSAFIGDFDDSFGIGLYVEGQDRFLAGVNERETTDATDPSMDTPTSYIAVIDEYLFQSFNPTTYEYYITTGNVNEIRNTFMGIALAQ